MSISVALFGVFIVIVIGVSLGAVSGYFGGLVDDAIQRVSELLLAIPKLPLWLALAAAVPRDMPTMERYVLIVIIASLTSWPGVARGVRSKLISLRNEDFVLAARSYGSSDRRIIFRYLVPNFNSYIIVAISLGIPAMILFETSLSFLGIGFAVPRHQLGRAAGAGTELHQRDLQPLADDSGDLRGGRHPGVQLRRRRRSRRGRPLREADVSRRGRSVTPGR